MLALTAGSTTVPVNLYFSAKMNENEKINEYGTQTVCVLCTSTEQEYSEYLPASQLSSCYAIIYEYYTY